MRKALPLLALLLSGCPQDDAAPPAAVEEGPWAFAVISDLHVGEGWPSYRGEEYVVTQRLRRAVARINAAAAAERLAFVFVLGDLTDSAEPAEFAKAREILDGLAVPYLPVLGNHDTWTYTDETEARAPAGDALFESIFADRYDGVAGLVRSPRAPVWNPEQSCWSLFQNFELRHRGVVFFGLDWNGRRHAIVDYRILLGDAEAWHPPGGHPGADLHDYPGGTFRWLTARLAQLPPDTRRVFLLQHHPFRAPAPIPDWWYGFTSSEKAKIRGALLDAAPADRYWEVLAGHFHRFASVDAFDEWPGFRQLETDACKESAAVTLIRVAPDGTALYVPMP